MRSCSAIAIATSFSACGGGGDDNQKGQSTLEVYADLTQSGIAAITQMQNGNLLIGYHRSISRRLRCRSRR